MTFKVTILPQARRNIDRNAAWWAEHHFVDEASQSSDAIYDQIAMLAEFPESHRLSAENGECLYEIRDKLLGSGSRPGYRAVFTIQNDTVYVLTVRRGAQDAVRPDDIESLPSD